jgi:hypothetical protein
MEPMGQNLTLSTSPTGRPPAAVPSGYALRSVTEADLNVLGHLYYDSYPPGVAGDNLDEAITDIEASFRGDYGELWPEASPVAVTAGELVAVIMTVTRPPGRTPPTARSSSKRPCTRPIANGDSPGRPWSAASTSWRRRAR